MEFAVADIDVVEWAPASFDCLTIPAEKKEILTALAMTRLGLVGGTSFDDVVTGKGRGLNVILQYVVLSIAPRCISLPH